MGLFKKHTYVAKPVFKPRIAEDLSDLKEQVDFSEYENVSNSVRLSVSDLDSVPQYEPKLQLEPYLECLPKTLKNEILNERMND